MSVGTYGALYVPADVSVEVCPLLGSPSEPRMKPGSEKDFPRLSLKTAVFFSAPPTFRFPLPLPSVCVCVCVWGVGWGRGGYP